MLLCSRKKIPWPLLATSFFATPMAIRPRAKVNGQGQAELEREGQHIKILALIGVLQPSSGLSPARPPAAWCGQLALLLSWRSTQPYVTQLASCHLPCFRSGYRSGPLPSPQILGGRACAASTAAAVLVLKGPRALAGPLAMAAGTQGFWPCLKVANTTPSFNS